MQLELRTSDGTNSYHRGYQGKGPQYKGCTSVSLFEKQNSCELPNQRDQKRPEEPEASMTTCVPFRLLVGKVCGGILNPRARIIYDSTYMVHDY